MLRLISISLIACLSTGCASIISGTNQSLSVVTRSNGTEVSGAKCILTNDKGAWYVTTPGSVTVHRSFNDLSVNCESAGFDTGIQLAKSSTKGVTLGNIFLAAGIGIGVDAVTGAAFDYPDVIQVSMGRAVAVVPAVAKVEPQK